MAAGCPSGPARSSAPATGSRGRPGRIVALAFDRWGDPGGTGSFGWHRFGGQVTGHAGFGGLTVPAQGRLGWDGEESFHYRLTGLEPSR